MNIIIASEKIVNRYFQNSDWKIGKNNVDFYILLGFVSRVGLETDWKGWEVMDYKISDICTNLGIGKSTIYDRIKILKKDIPESDWKSNEYFYYTDNNKLFITSKGFEFIKNYRNKSFNTGFNPISDSSSFFQNQIIKMYEARIEYLEAENKRLLDIISFKEQKEFAKDVKYIDNGEKLSFWNKLFYKFKK